MYMEKEIISTDLVIIGAGPAGMSAGIYALRAGIRPVILEKGIVGGQVYQSSTVENYPGCPGITGAELSERFRGHLLSLGGEIDEFDFIERAELSDSEKRIVTEQHIYEPTAVIIATGAVPKALPVKNEPKFRGKGIHYCAVCDGPAYRDRTVGVIGGGSAAAEEALYLAGLAEKVLMIRRKDSFNAERAIIEKLESTPNIEILYNTDLIETGGGDCLEYALVNDVLTHEKRRIPLSAIFTYIGSSPQTDFLKKSVRLNQDGYIPTDEDMRTSVSGVFAAGDVRVKHYRQIVTAVSDGAVAALGAEKYITSMKVRNRP